MLIKNLKTYVANYFQKSHPPHRLCPNKEAVARWNRNNTEDAIVTMDEIIESFNSECLIKRYQVECRKVLSCCDATEGEYD